MKIIKAEFALKGLSGIVLTKADDIWQIEYNKKRQPIKATKLQKTQGKLPAHYTVRIKDKAGRTSTYTHEQIKFMLVPFVQEIVIP